MGEKRIGLIAGNGKFPLISLRKAKAEGFSVFTCAVKGEADPAVIEESSHGIWVKLGQIKKLADFFKACEVKECFMAGKITKTNLFKGEVVPDLDMIRLAANLRDHKDDSLLGAIANYLVEKGIAVIDSTRFLKEELAGNGILSKKKPSREQLDDIAFGWHLAKEIGRLDIGQCVIVKNKSILAVEAIEGTDQAIARAGLLGGSGAVIVKVAKPDQDMRFDVPVVGTKTLEAMQKAKASVLAVEAEKTIILEREEFFEKLNKAGLVLVGR